MENVEMFTPKTVVNFEGFLMRKLRFLRKKLGLQTKVLRHDTFRPAFASLFASQLSKKNLTEEYKALLWNVEDFGNHDYFFNYIFHQFQNATSKCRVLCQRTKKTTFAKFCSKNSIKKQLVIPEYHKFLIVFTRIARNVIDLSFTLTTVSGKRFCTQQIVTKPDTAKSLQNKRNFKSSTHTFHQTCLYIYRQHCNEKMLDEPAKKVIIQLAVGIYSIIFSYFCQNNFVLSFEHFTFFLVTSSHCKLSFPWFEMLADKVHFGFFNHLWTEVTSKLILRFTFIN